MTAGQETRRVSLERHTVLAAQAGDPGSINRVLTACEGIISHVARRKKPWQPSQTEDMAQSARIDVWVHALSKWEEGRSSFSTYAAWWARSGAGKEAKREKRLKDKERSESEVWYTGQGGQEPSIVTKKTDLDGGWDGSEGTVRPLDAASCCRRSYLGMVDHRERELSEVQEALFVCIRKLNTTEQRVLQFTFWDTKTFREVADLSQDPTWGMEPIGKSKVGDVRNTALGRLRGMLTAKEFETWL